MKKNDNNFTEINLREKEFHDKAYSLENKRFENIFYTALHNLIEDFFDFLKKNIKDKKVLDYGCGGGAGYIIKILDFDPKKLVAIDISDKGIEEAKKDLRSFTLALQSQGRTVKIKNDQIEFRVENCENTSLDSNSFDVIYGAGILHHINLKKSLEEIDRLLKKDGVVIFTEPMGTNPIINIYRKFTPKARSDDEVPLSFKDIDLIKSVFKNSNIKYYGFLTLIFLPLYKGKKRKNYKIYEILYKMDSVIFKIKFLRFLAWSVLITAKKN